MKFSLYVDRSYRIQCRERPWGGGGGEEMIIKPPNSDQEREGR